MPVKAKENYKHQQIKSPINPSYHYTPGSTINITATGMSTSHVISTFGQFPFQSKQRKEDLLGPYSTYFEGFKSQSSMPSGLQSPLPQPDFGTVSSWKVTDLEKEQKEESEDQEFTYQNLIPKNPNIETPNFQTQQNPNLENPEIETLNFQTHLANKPQDFAVFKLAFLQYFSNNNSINWLVNTFTTIKQRENEAVTTYLGCFHRNLCQIQAIQTDYFTVSQILNQFIRGLYSSILQCVYPMHPADLQAAVTNV
ncbi:hypothetical protein G9A89_016546 [Geosiphon pyriformis]|nr:hypothetical protein G9A89_016546 [Geosiphon pyriformis]